MKICPKCGKEHEKQGVFCSRHCANSRNHSETTKRKIAETLMTSGKRFQPPPRPKKDRPPKQPKPQGGFREGSGRAKTGYYRGIYCGSTYELAWVIYQIDHGIPFERFRGCLEFGGRKYFPDFLQDGKIIEIKGYEDQASVDVKNNIARENGYDVIVLRKENLQKEFTWVKENHSKDFKTLYDDYKPNYKYVCVCCNSPFSRDKPRNAKHIVCSRSCSLKMNREISRHNQYTHREAAGVAPSPSN
jgi:hypothetical protein